jgi:predicted transcriptional regulator of viral defense system
MNPMQQSSANGCPPDFHKLFTMSKGIKFTQSANLAYHYIVMQQHIAPLPPSRARLASVLRAATEVVSVDIASTTLKIKRREAAKLLSRWQGQGWLRRIGHGLYVPVPLDLATSEQVIADPWVLVPTLFGQCYIGGWTAANHWELTEQLFNETFVFTTRRVTEKQVVAQGAAFLLHSVNSKRLFGLKTLWRGSTKVAISDPARTLVDMLAAPEVGGGIDHVAECLGTYLKGKTTDRAKLIRHAEEFGNGAVFKRLGFLADSKLDDEQLANACRVRLTHGYAKLDPSLRSTKLITAWRLWVPETWKARPA